ncbi:ExbD/TolR family protein [Aquabacterium sp. J223]|uniref:ExbD/TolR family protein n=1 Tax=Aquabacterium sp. J223 TaxID=2898431 RepID=UPI0021AE2095|nr:biopolymer transporter ExbD [Aquabacterium sp. J223]UUX94581.1 biopolymer transporter ExbD [Aquabacterium sp. J223]
MAMSLGSPDGDDEPIVEMNTTPLIDVMLVLLIMLIVTIPIQTHALRVDTPRPSSSPPPTEPAPQRLVIEADGSVDWNGERLADRSAWTARLDALAAQADPPTLTIKPDRRVPYRHVAALLAAAQQRGLQKVAIVDDPTLAP